MSLLPLTKLYDLLYEHYGPQGWWPLISFESHGVNPTERGRFTWYHPKNYSVPECEVEMFEIMVGAILTQNTSWENADKALGKLHESSCLNISSICKILTEDLAQLIRSSGYYNQKALKLQSLAKFLSTEPISTLQTHTTGQLRERLLAVSGIGPETADSILLYAFMRPIFVVDTYTRRLVSRLGYMIEKWSYTQLQSLFHDNLEPEVPLFNEFHALIVQHCVRICKKRPNCSVCFLQSLCVQQFPPPKIFPKKATRLIRKTEIAGKARTMSKTKSGGNLKKTSKD